MNREHVPLVLVLSTAYLPFTGGAEAALYEIMKRSHKFRFLVLTSRFSRSVPHLEISGNIKIRRLGFGFSFDKWLLTIFGFLVGAFVLMRERRAILWGMMVSQGTIAGYFLKFFFRRTPFVVTLQEGDSEEHLSRGRLGLLGFFWKRIMRRANAVTAISEHLKSRAIKAGFIGDVLVIPNGVDEHLVSVAFERSADSAIKNELGIAPDAKVVLSVSRLVPKNGLADLIDAVAILLKCGLNIHFVLAGGGGERARLAERIERHGIVNKVHFVGSVPYGETWRYYRMSDVFCRPSHSEGLGSAFLEAMGAGVPIVATTVGGISDFLKDGETGIAVRAGDSESIADGIRRVLEDDALRNKIVEQARALVIEKYLWVDIAKKTESVLLGAHT